MKHMKVENVYGKRREKWLERENCAVFPDIWMFHYKCHMQNHIYALILYLNIQINSAKHLQP